MAEHLNAVVALSGEFAPGLDAIGPGTQQRMDVAMALVEAEDVPLVVSGSHTFRMALPPRPLAHLMRDYAYQQGMAEDQVLVQDQSLDTIGDALFTKTQIAEPRGWTNLAIVTSDAHAPRGQRIFAHVMGPDYRIDAVPAGTIEAIRFQRLQEFVGNTLVRAVLGGTQPGDTQAIHDRLFRIIPGYADVSLPSRLFGALPGLVAG